MVVKHLCSFSASCLNGAVSAWRRYTSLLKRLPPPTLPHFPADPAVITVFLAHVGAGDKITAQESTSRKLKGNVRGGDGVVVHVPFGQVRGSFETIWK